MLILHLIIFPGVTPQPVMQRFKLGPNFKGCSDVSSKEEVISSFNKRLTTSLPCVLTEECKISDLSCESTDENTFLSVRVTSTSAQNVQGQRLILETAVDYLTSYPLHAMLDGPSSVC